MKKIFALIILIEILIAGASFNSAQAADEGYTLLEPLPGLGSESGSEIVSLSLSDYLQWLYVFAISIAGIAVVIKIAIGGVRYIISYGNPGKMASAKEDITNALLGLLLIVSAWLILYTINPDLVQNSLTIPDITTPFVPGGGEFRGAGASGG